MAGPEAQLKTAPIVAELGRPETPEETAARKAESARNRRANQTPINLLLSIGASLVLVLFLVLVVVRPTAQTPSTVDWKRVAAEAQPTVAEPLARPVLGDAWTANNAELATGADGIQTWYVGFITPQEQFIGLTQGIAANPTWVANQVAAKVATGTETIDGTTWTVFDYRASKDSGNLAFAMTADIAYSSIVLFGTASTAEFDSLALAVSTDLGKAK
jgi:Protein of unknown function (DUF4245)